MKGAAAIAACLFAVIASPSFVFAQKPGSAPAPPTPQQERLARDAEAEAELEKALAAADNNSVAVIRNLKEYLNRYPDAPRKAAVYRALVEACQQTQDDKCALDYAERLIAIQPADADMMLLAAHLLQQRGDDASLTRAAGYVTRVLDQTEKAIPDAKPERESLADWRAGQNQLLTNLYYARGAIERAEHKDEEASADFQASYSVEPNALAAEALGEAAEARHDLQDAVDEYALAFVLPESGPAGTVDRREVRRKIGNVWRQLHGDAPGLGEAILAAYDRINAANAAGNPPSDAPSQ